MKKKILELLVCPRCYGKLAYNRKQNEVICHRDGLAFSIREGIPVLLEADARVLASINSTPGSN